MKPTLWLVLVAGGVTLGLAIYSRGESPTQPPEAVTGFDDQSNGFSDLSRRQADQKFFEEVEHIAPDGLGPLYNAQSCRECHQTPVTGAASQVAEFRIGHLDARGQFQNPQIPINHGAAIRSGAAAKFYSILTPDQKAKADQMHQRAKQFFEQRRAQRNG